MNTHTPRNPIDPIDIVILGGGPVGQACALLLARHWPDPRRIALIDAKTAEQSAQDPRTLALSQGSRQILERIAGWPTTAVTPIETIHISHRGHFGCTHIQQHEYGLPALGYVTSYRALIQQLQQQLSRSGIQILRPMTALTCEDTADGVRIEAVSNSHAATGTSPTMIQAALAVHAEGSLLHTSAPATNVSAQEHHQQDYHQHAVVAFVTVTNDGHNRQHHHAHSRPPYTAFERFTTQGPLALLPHQQQHQNGYALVWCCRPAQAQALLHLSESEFLAALQREFGQRAGRFSSVSTRHAFPLGLNLRTQLVTGHSVHIGNAAQMLHPVAGQGLNLGLRDAFTLMQLLNNPSATFSAKLLQHYPSQRHADRQITRHTTSLLASLFADHGHLMAPIASAGLTLLDLLPPLKKPLAQHMIFGQR